jgi:uncharacterized protein YgiM (DUF1202 family)
MRKSLIRGVAGVAAIAAVLGAVAPAMVSAKSAAIVVNQAVELVVTSPTANIRSGPSTGERILGTVAKGTRLRADAKTADNAWFRVDYNGQKAFIFAQLVAQSGTPEANAAGAAPAPAAPAPVAAAPAPAAAGTQSVAVTTPFLNVRSQPSTASQILGQLKQGQSVAADAKTADGQWLRINYNGKAAFVWAAFTTFGKSAAPAPAAPAAGAPAPAAPSALAPAPAASGAFEVGAHIKEPERLDLMTQNGMTWVKYQIQFDGGSPDATGIINQVRGSGMKILIGAVGNRGRVGDAGYHKEFAQVLAGFARQGADAIEVWNEPNLPREFGSDAAPQVSPENYFNMLREAHAAIKAANPATLVVGGAPAPTGYWGGNCSQAGCDDKPFLERLAALGAGSYMDCQGVHYNGSPNPPDLREGGNPGGHYSWYFWGTFDTSYNAIRKPICMTEMGYVTKDGIAGALPGGFAWGNGITLANQAEWSGRLVTLLRSSGRARLAIFWNWNFRKFDDDPQAGYSLLRPDGSCPSCPSIKAAMGR